MRTNIGLAAAVLASGLVAQAMGAVVSAPFSENFAIAPGAEGSQMAVCNDRSGASTWEAVAGGTRHTYTDNSWGVATAGAYANVSNLAGATDFAVSVDLTPISKGVYAGGTGLVAKSSTASLGGWSSAYYAAQLGLAGSTVNLSIVQSNPSNYPTVLASTPFGELKLNTKYHMTFTGDYTVDGLTLALAVSEVGNPTFTPVTVTHEIASGAILSGLGTGFGVRDQIQAGTAIIEYGNLSISSAVPEPVTLSFVLLGGMGLMARRRKSA